MYCFKSHLHNVAHIIKRENSPQGGSLFLGACYQSNKKELEAMSISVNEQLQVENTTSHELLFSPGCPVPFFLLTFFFSSLTFGELQTSVHTGLWEAKAMRQKSSPKEESESWDQLCEC